MDSTAFHPPHSPATREVLRKAGMSEESELTEGEWWSISAAREALESNPRISQNRLYRIIRPRQEFPDDD